MCFSAGQFQKYIYQRQYTKASSVLTVGHKFHHIIQRTPQCFADLSHGFNRDVFISGHLENDLVADTLGLFKIFLFHIPVDQQFPKLFIAYIYTVSLNSIRIYSKNRNSWSWLSEYNIIFLAKMQNKVNDFRTHKSVKNTDLNMYFKENHHTAIIKKEDWIKVQKLLSERNNTAKRATLRRLSNHFVAYRVKDGLFKG